ncbi:MAG TPA: TIR domain-containing protein [Reyranella sp.]|nr:TIR domain-containing protein [Reyranella sp.]
MPERYHAFISYTTREHEVRQVKPIVDEFLNRYLKPLIRGVLGELPVFYDGWSLDPPSNRSFDESTLKYRLAEAIRDSEMMLAFVSPSYLSSRWCHFELATMAPREREPVPAPIVPIFWKGDHELFSQSAHLCDRIGHDLRCCVPWRTEKDTWRIEENDRCREAMRRTAEAIVSILRKRREAYRRLAESLP